MELPTHSTSHPRYSKDASNALLRENHPMVLPQYDSPAAFWSISTPGLSKIQLKQKPLWLLDNLMLAEPQAGGPRLRASVDHSGTRAAGERTWPAGSTVQARLQRWPARNTLQRHLWLGRGKKGGCVLQHGHAEIPCVPEPGHISEHSYVETPGSEHWGAAPGKQEEPQAKSSSSFGWGRRLVQG